jgi:hypothetical protein
MVFGPTARRFLPYVNFVVATAALGFQTTVLYPWHVQLDEGFHMLQQEQARMLQEYHVVKLQRLAELEQKINRLERRAEVCQPRPEL